MRGDMAPRKVTVSQTSSKSSSRSQSPPTVEKYPAPMPSPVKGAATSASASKTFTMDEIRNHTMDSDAWVVVDDRVFDVTEFLENHPGGKQILYNYLGTDISEAFRGTGGHTHSENAHDMLQEYEIGVVAGATTSRVSSETTSSSPTVRLDLTKPIVCQVANLGKSYNSYIHKPQHLKEPARFFESDFLEFWSRTPWYYIPLLWLPVVCLMLYSSHLRGQSITQLCVMFVLGILSWTLLEYSLHRFVFHVDPKWIHLNKYTITFHFLIHGVHHLLPMDPMRLVFPVIPAAGIMVPIYTFFHTTFGARDGLCLMAGAVFGYVCYDLTHFYLHHGVPVGQYFRNLKSYHLAHHYKNPDLGFGISSKLWDHVLDTRLTT